MGAVVGVVAEGGAAVGGCAGAADAQVITLAYLLTYVLFIRPFFDLFLD